MSMHPMNLHPVQGLTDWILRDAAQRPECAQYDLSEVDFLCRKYLRHSSLLRNAPSELLHAADRITCGLLRHRHPALFATLPQTTAEAA